MTSPHDDDTLHDAGWQTDERRERRDDSPREWDVHRPHGGIGYRDHAEFFTVDHRYLADPSDPMAEPERNQTVDDYDSMVHGAGSRTQADIGGRDPSRVAGAAGHRDDLPDAEPG